MSWFHRSESVEHFFGIARQLNPDFDFSDLIQMLSKISQYTKALRSMRTYSSVALIFLMDYLYWAPSN